MRHIVLITTSYPVSSDGSEAAGSFVMDFACALAEKVRITVIAPGVKKDFEKISGNFVIQRFYAPRQPLSLLKAYNPLHWLAIFTTLVNGRAIVEDVVKYEKVDHILALWVLPSGYWAWSIAKHYKISFSTWALGSDIWRLGRIPLIKNILQIVLRDSCCNFADGFQLKKDVATLSKRLCHFLPSTRTLHIPKEKKLSEEPPYRIAFVGRWHRNKGVDLLLDSLMLLGESSWHRIEEVRICGGGPMEHIVKSGISALGEQGRPVTSLGYLNKDEAVELLLWADYILIPSRIESIPVVFSDAMKCRCPVVCMPVGDLPRLIQKYQVGILATKVTAQSFSDAIGEILKQAPRKFAVALKQSSHDFNMENAVHQLISKLFGND